MARTKKQTPKLDTGYYIAGPCSCGGRIRTWILPDRKDYVDDNGNPVRHGDRVAKCLTCWKDKTGMVAESIARGQR